MIDFLFGVLFGAAFAVAVMGAVALVFWRSWEEDK